jgi:hypothetical protein
MNKARVSPTRVIYPLLGSAAAFALAVRMTWRGTSRQERWWEWALPAALFAMSSLAFWRIARKRLRSRMS